MTARKRPSRADSQRQKVTLYLRTDHIESARGAVLWAQIKGADPASLSALVDEAIRRELARLLPKLKPQAGKFPRVKKGLPGGRPPGQRR